MLRGVRHPGATVVMGIAFGILSCERALSAPEHAGDALLSADGATPTVRFVGRFDMSDPQGPRFAWAGTSISARFSGTAIDVRLHDEGSNVFQVIVDGVPTAALATGPARDDYTLATGLRDGVHEVILYKRTEPRHGEVRFLGFVQKSAADGSLSAPGQRPVQGIPAPALPAASSSPAPIGSRRIEFVGDSITVGYGNEGVGPICPGPRTENEFLSFAALTARAFGAEHFSLAWSGRTVEDMASLYERTLPARPDSRWDFSSWTPDVVVINLGTNDFTRGDPGQSTFTRPYTALIQRVRTRYPAARIVCALGPMMTDTYPPGAHALTRARGYITSVVESLRARGDAKVSFVEFPAQDPNDGLGCDFHPSLKTHRRMADELVTALRAQMGW
jgi:lysophospholipase L1-like esterase